MPHGLSDRMPSLVTLHDDLSLTMTWPCGHAEPAPRPWRLAPSVGVTTRLQIALRKVGRPGRAKQTRLDCGADSGMPSRLNGYAGEREGSVGGVWPSGRWNHKAHHSPTALSDPPSPP